MGAGPGGERRSEYIRMTATPEVSGFPAQAHAIGAGAALSDAWATRLRHEALERFEGLGLPTARRGNEGWKYTNVGPIAKATFELPPPAAMVGEEWVQRLAPWSRTWLNLVFVNGRFAPELSSPPVHEPGITASSLAIALASDGAVARERLGQLSVTEGDGFASLNAAFLHDGALVHVGAEARRPVVNLVHLAVPEGRPAASHPRTLVVAEANSNVTIIESYVGAHEASTLTNAVTEVVLEAGARVERTRILAEPSQAYHVGRTHVHVGRDAHFADRALSLGTAIARQELHVALAGPGASCRLTGLSWTTGKQHLDSHTSIDHATERTTSRQRYKSILDGKSRSVFTGRVLVRPGSQKADAEQSNPNLLLSEGAEADSKPSFEIFADDVRCVHGATVGQLDEQALFYLRSRGLDDEMARRLLLRAFAGEVLEAIESRPLRRFAEGLFDGAIGARKGRTS